MESATTKQNSVLLAVLAYIGPLVIVSFIFSRNNPFVKFHAKQGLVLFFAEIIMWFVGTYFWTIWPIIDLVNLCILILAIVGIVHAVDGKEKKLPIVGHLANSMKL